MEEAYTYNLQHAVYYRGERRQRRHLQAKTQEATVLERTIAQPPVKKQKSRDCYSVTFFLLLTAW
jgi:hypothetical protein